MLRVFKQYYPIRNILFVIGEGVIIYLGVMFASLLILGSESTPLDSMVFVKVFIITLVFQTCLYYYDLYDFKSILSFNELGIRLLQALGVGSILLALFYAMVPFTVIEIPSFILSIILVILFSICWRFGYSLILIRGWFNESIVLLGSGDLIEEIRSEIKNRMDCGYSVLCDFPESKHSSSSKESKDQCQSIGRQYEGLAHVAKSMRVKKVVAAFKEKRQELPTEELLHCRMEGIDVIDGNNFYEMLTGKLLVKQVPPSWLIFSEGFNKSRPRLFLKQFLDIFFSVCLLILFLPLILIVAVLIKLDSKGPVIFSQERLGENRKAYRIYKFRSMVVDAENKSGPIWAEENDERVTRVGRFLRKWRIDEVPQLWNVLKGEMSFVGPRPEREFFVQELEKKIPYYGFRFAIKPGITGWAQVCYEYGSSFEDAIEKLNYELFYIKNMSPLMDLMIVLRTIKIVLFGRGAR
jgi:sugar transferase (PEP-CTERM system associated)